MEEKLIQHIEDDMRAHEKVDGHIKDIHIRIDAIQVAQNELVEEIKGLREDITPIINVFDAIQIYLKGGKFIGTATKAIITIIATLIGLTWASIQIINFFTK